MDNHMDGALATSDDALVAQAQAGSEAAFTVLVARHYDRIHRMAWRWTGSETAAEDVAQDVCVKLAGAIAGFRADAAFTTWLHRITYNAAVDHLRAGQRTSTVAPSQIMALVDDAAVRGDGDIGASPETLLIGAELWDEVRNLPPQQRDAILLVYAEDMSHGEAAAVMGCTEKTVSWHLFEARKKLKIKLQAVG